mmetsp:Transcript_80847/g.233806  ORF Transcript_80847/g.233806 Transcript_80847/m.233806 type:complete len:326 (+) Transcript_80847:561-1538(+)
MPRDQRAAQAGSPSPSPRASCGATKVTMTTTCSSPVEGTGGDPAYEQEAISSTTALAASGASSAAAITTAAVPSEEARAAGEAKDSANSTSSEATTTCLAPSAVVVAEASTTTWTCSGVDSAAAAARVAASSRARRGTRARRAPGRRTPSRCSSPMWAIWPRTRSERSSKRPETWSASRCCGHRRVLRRVFASSLSPQSTRRRRPWACRGARWTAGAWSCALPMEATSRTRAAEKVGRTIGTATTTGRRTWAARNASAAPLATTIATTTAITATGSATPEARARAKAQAVAGWIAPRSTRPWRRSSTTPRVPSGSRTSISLRSKS